MRRRNWSLCRKRWTCSLLNLTAELIARRGLSPYMPTLLYLWRKKTSISDIALYTISQLLKESRCKEHNTHLRRWIIWEQLEQSDEGNLLTKQMWEYTPLLKTSLNLFTSSTYQPDCMITTSQKRQNAMSPSTRYLRANWRANWVRIKMPPHTWNTFSDLRSRPKNTDTSMLPKMWRFELDHDKSLTLQKLLPAGLQL